LKLLPVAAVIVALFAGPAHGEEEPRADPRWQKLVDRAKDDLAHDRLADARDHAFDAQRIGDTPETSALLASALFSLGLVEDDKTQLSHASLLAEKCLQQLDEKTLALDENASRAIRTSCLSIAARAYQGLGQPSAARTRATECLALRADNPELARLSRGCRRIVDETRSDGSNAHGGVWWRYLVFSAQGGYGFRWLSATLASPGARLDGYNFEIAVGYPNLSLGPLVLRVEALFRSESLGTEVYEPSPTGGVASATSSASVLAVGTRVALTYPGRLMTLELAVGLTGSQLRAPATLVLLDDKMQTTTYTTADWAPELGVSLRWGAPEVRVGSLAFVFATFLELSYAFDWHLESPTAPPRDLNSFAVCFGVALRFRLGDLQPYD
jgi:hypothetical protein